MSALDLLSFYAEQELQKQRPRTRKALIEVVNSLREDLREVEADYSEFVRDALDVSDTEQQFAEAYRGALLSLEIQEHFVATRVDCIDRLEREGADGHHAQKLRTEYILLKARLLGIRRVIASMQTPPTSPVA